MIWKKHSSTALTAAVTLAAAVSLILAGCSGSNGKDPTMGHSDTKAELDGLMMIAQDSVGGDWKRGDSGAEECEMPSGTIGARWAFARFGPGIGKAEQQPIIDAVVAGWAEADLVATVVQKSLGDADYTAVEYPKSGYGIDGLYIVFEMGETSTNVRGQTRCVPGDHRKINREYQESHPPAPQTPAPSLPTESG
jgi:hypothetical protein